jgi:hypothetical protein
MYVSPAGKCRLELPRGQLQGIFKLPQNILDKNVENRQNIELGRIFLFILWVK